MNVCLKMSKCVKKKYKKMSNQSQLANQSSVVDADPQLNVTVTEESNVLCFFIIIVIICFFI